MVKAGFVEVGPRDGFQNVQEFIPTEVKIKIVDMLVAAGAERIEATSFVNPRAVPQMQDSKAVAEYCLKQYPHVDFFALVPNLRGAQDAYASGLREISYVISVSESHNQANVRRSTAESFAELAEIRHRYHDLRINLDLATAFGCPFEGAVPQARVFSFVGQALELGIRDIVFCDTIGIAVPPQIEAFARKIKTLAHRAETTYEVHIHDTRNMGILNSFLAIRQGFDGVQASVGGLGGCPFAPGASGNTASEDLVYVLQHSEIDCGIDFAKMLACAKFAKSKIDGNFSGHQINIGEQKCQC